MSEFKKYLEINYEGELAPEVELPEPDKVLVCYSPKMRKQYHREVEARMTQNFVGKTIYPELIKIDSTDTYFERDGYNVPVRIYHPEGEGPFPIVMFNHGGGWMINNINIYDYVTKYIARFSGAVVISVEYRLAPQNKFPVGLEDCYGALEWAAKNASSFNGDPNHISIVGDSAGGNLSAVVSLMARDKNGPKIENQILIYPATDLQNMMSTDSCKRYSTGYFLELNDETDPTAIYLNNKKEATNPYVSPLLADNLSNLPHATFISAECDPVLDGALFYAQRLSDSGVKVDYHLYKGMFHGFLNETYGKTFEALDVICNAIKSDYKSASAD